MQDKRSFELIYDYCWYNPLTLIVKNITNSMHAFYYNKYCTYFRGTCTVCIWLGLALENSCCSSSRTLRCSAVGMLSATRAPAQHSSSMTSPFSISSWVLLVLWIFLSWSESLLVNDKLMLSSFIPFPSGRYDHLIQWICWNQQVSHFWETLHKYDHTKGTHSQNNQYCQTATPRSFTKFCVIKVTITAVSLLKNLEQYIWYDLISIISLTGCLIFEERL